MLLSSFNPYINFEDAMGIVITGLAVVFLVLIVLVIIFYIMGSFFTPKKKKEEKEVAPAPKKTEAPAPTPAPKKTSDSGLAVVAAITAALNEYLGAGNFIIKKIRPAKIGKKSSGAWGTDGKSENVRPF